MVEGFLKHVNILINESDLIIEILDARRPDETRNKDLERILIGRRKKLLLVINKSDLVEKEALEKKKNEIERQTKSKVIFVSALKKDGINMIRRQVAAAKQKDKKLTIGIIGYPNVGKSTLINTLAGKGRGRVATSRKAGLTRGITRVKITDGVYLIDSPGIIPRMEDEFDLFLVESKNPNQLKNVERVALKLIQYLGKEFIAKNFGIENFEELDEEELLDEIGRKKNLLVKGGNPDMGKAARFLLEKYQKHELK